MARARRAADAPNRFIIESAEAARKLALDAKPAGKAPLRAKSAAVPPAVQRPKSLDIGAETADAQLPLLVRDTTTESTLAATPAPTSGDKSIGVESLPPFRTPPDREAIRRPGTQQPDIGAESTATAAPVRPSPHSSAELPESLPPPQPIPNAQTVSLSESTPAPLATGNALVLKKMVRPDLAAADCLDGACPNKVLIKFTVQCDGSVTDIRILAYISNSALARVIVAAVRQWQYERIQVPQPTQMFLPLTGR